MVNTATLGENQITALLQENRSLRRWKTEHEIEDLYRDIKKNFLEFLLVTLFMFGGVTYARKIRLEDGQAYDTYFWVLVIAAGLLHLRNAHFSYKYVRRVGSRVHSKEEELRKDLDSGEMIGLGVGVESVRFWLIYVLFVTVTGALYAIHLVSCVYNDYSQVPGKVDSSM